MMTRSQTAQKAQEDQEAQQVEIAWESHYAGYDAFELAAEALAAAGEKWNAIRTRRCIKNDIDEIIVLYERAIELCKNAERVGVDVKMLLDEATTDLNEVKSRRIQ